jgi:hypothetical protein
MDKEGWRTRRGCTEALRDLGFNVGLRPLLGLRLRVKLFIRRTLGLRLFCTLGLRVRSRSRSRGFDVDFPLAGLADAARLG